MSDPFSIATGTAGLVSLGLTLCKGLAEYISAVKGHGEDVKNLETKLNTLQMFLAAVDATLKEVPHLQGSRLSGDVVRVVKASLDQSKDGMVRLAEFLEECSGRTHSPSSSAACPSKLQNMGKKAVYYFRRGALKELEQMLESVQGQLNLSLNLLNVRLLTSQSQECRQISECMSLSTARLADLQSSVAGLENKLSNTSETVTTLSESLTMAQGDFQLTTTQFHEVGLLQTVMSLIALIAIPFLNGTLTVLRRAYRAVPRSILSLPTDNIIFEDMLGRSFSLQFSLVCEWRIFEAFLITRFEDIPGESFVNSGQYHLLHGIHNMVLPRSRRGWANSISPGSKIVMSLRADNHFPDHCPRCGAALNNGPGSLLVKCTTIGCWTAFQETGDAIANFLENGSGLESLDCFSNRITKTQEMDLTPFTRIHFYSLYYNPETSYCPKCFLGLFKLARFLTKEKGFDSFIRDQMACPDL
ncbi:uncharacterized protein NECHADRAFT_85201 [Fusarium vanettenii 77-13-4]|uniref:Ubiquitin-like domain-containing protein n=1 Tax=Fusarium vanettenii (strain ATCC MYA-4622 / CBS 123669 / FGSC 9596 / NRRL 45880 / 77-13-4) TaxID=660122 RepID=C7YVA0_FUSV7|nr:uncharacterized protein NECHADRAFT_85201 [Fusarium vanettenii 77-13-4]EEU44947.1 hypothetical protein NECHADRAFT_85201 [Fusarium vanettenii 77-13-4]